MDVMEGILWLALNIYFEARNQSLEGQYAVAHVTLNRAEITGKSIKAVVLEPGQFSWVRQQGVTWKTPVKRIPIKEKKAFERCKQVAKTAYMMNDPTYGATHYHANYVRPKWAKRLKQTARIGKHIFYRRHR